MLIIEVGFWQSVRAVLEVCVWVRATDVAKCLN